MIVIVVAEFYIIDEKEQTLIRLARNNFTATGNVWLLAFVLTANETCTGGKLESWQKIEPGRQAQHWRFGVGIFGMKMKCAKIWSIIS